MIIGRLNKEMKEICLLDQVYVQDSDLTVAKYVEKVAKENGANMTVKKFVRFETGEGLEKKNEDFAAEFFTSFTIEQIGKEFDLIKIDMDTLVLNIELKSEDVGVEAI